MRAGIWKTLFSFIGGLFAATCVAQAQSSVTVTDDGFSFSPEQVYIVTGQIVYWVDDGSGPYLIIGPWGSFPTPGGIQFLGAGTYDYSDDAGDYGTVHVTANVPPSVTITNPANSSVFTAPASFTLAADASDTDSDGMSDVEFYVGNDLVDDVFSEPYATSLTDLPAGSYVLTAIAYDNGGATATNTITISVQNPSVITLSAPTLAGGRLWFNATGLTVGKTNLLQVSTDLSSLAGWVSLATNISANSSETFTNQVPGKSGFFRLVQLP